jgi:hypothetical protein
MRNPLGCEKRLEDLRLNGFIHAATRVADPQVAAEKANAQALDPNNPWAVRAGQLQAQALDPNDPVAIRFRQLHPKEANDMIPACGSE